MGIATRDKLQFIHAMTRHSRATVRQCEALMRYAGTLQRLAEDDCNVATDDAGLAMREAKKLRIANQVIALCSEIRASETFSLRYHLESIKTNLTGKDYPQERWKRSLQYADEALAQDYSDAALGEPCVPVFSNDPHGAVLKIRVPDGFSNSFGDEGIVVPA